LAGVFLHWQLMSDPPTFTLSSFTNWVYSSLNLTLGLPPPIQSAPNFRNVALLVEEAVLLLALFPIFLSYQFGTTVITPRFIALSVSAKASSYRTGQSRPFRRCAACCGIGFVSFWPISGSASVLSKAFQLSTSILPSLSAIN